MNATPYLVLGVRPFINCCSVRTMHGGSLMLPQVRDAMAEASRHFVNLDELMEAAGQRLAELTGAEWGIVTCGSAAAVALGTAACVAGNDPVKMLRLPFTEGMVNHVVIPKTQRFAYDQAAGNLTYDAFGSSNPAAQVLIDKLGAGTRLAASDFLFTQ